MPLKVLVISNYRETVSVRPEAELFIGLKKAGLDVTIMTYGDSDYVKKFAAAGIKVIDFHPEKKLDRKEIKFIRAALISEKYDILHLFNSKAIINGIQAAKKLPVKVVLYRGYTGNIHWYDPTAYFKYLHPSVDAIFCNTKSVKEHIGRQLKFSKKMKLVTIEKGHQTIWYDSIKKVNRTELKEVTEKNFWVTCTANNRPVKGINFLIKAINFLPKNLPISLLLIGKDMDKYGTKELISKNPNRNKIHSLGYRNNALEIVKSSDCFISPSLSESLQKAVIEAMSLGIAPIITDIPGNKGLVIDGECGLVVPPSNPKALAEAIVKLYEDRKLCQRFGDNARKQIENNFNIETTIKKTKLLYEQLTQAN